MAVDPADITILAQEIGPCLTGTVKERRAAHTLVERLQALGVAATLLPVRTPPSLGPIYGTLFIFIALGVPIAALSPPLGFVISLLGAGFLVLELTGQGILAHIFATRRSNNVLGIIPAVINDEIGLPARRVILTAHVDTARSGMIWHRSLVNAFRQLVIVTLLLSCIIPILLFAFSLSNDMRLWDISWIPFALLILAATLVLESELRGVPLVGANDNASGIAALLAVATALKHDQPRHVETWFLFTTGQEAGLSGMTSFLIENSFESETTFFINVDHVGAGQIHFTREDGLLRSRPASSRLIRLVAEIGARHPDWTVTPVVHRLLPTDAFAAMKEGYQAITILAQDKAANLPSWHQTTDTVELIEMDTVQIAADLTRSLVKRLDKEVFENVGREEENRTPLRDRTNS